ncbi:type III-A CRISPR-associated RAMP protein Csm3, partial [Candidatus Kuenenia stuttgartiensis]
TEWKFENSLDRVTAAANPRQLERIPAGAKFEFEIVYNVEASNGEAKKDLSNLLELISLLQDDYLGGHGSRGYGKVGFTIDKFMARKLEFYRATSEEDKKSNSSILENKTIDECKQNVDEILSMFDTL